MPHSVYTTDCGKEGHAGPCVPGNRPGGEERGGGAGLRALCPPQVPTTPLLRGPRLAPHPAGLWLPPPPRATVSVSMRGSVWLSFSLGTGSAISARAQTQAVPGPGHRVGSGNQTALSCRPAPLAKPSEPQCPQLRLGTKTVLACGASKKTGDHTAAVPSAEGTFQRQCALSKPAARRLGSLRTPSLPFPRPHLV